MNVVKRIITQFLIGLYLFFLLGFFIHTSNNPTIFEKYTVKYFLMLCILSVGFIVWIGILVFINKSSTLKKGKKKIVIEPWKKVVVLVGILLLFLGVIEYHYRQKYADVESNTYTFRIENYHPFLGSTLSIYDNLHINSWGFRGDEITKQKPTNTYRIVLLGGSTVLNRPITYDKTFGKLMQDSLQKKYPSTHIEVLNAANDWYTTQHSLIQYLFYIKDFHPDLVIMWHGVNDLFRSCTSGEFSYGPYREDYGNFYGPTTTMAKNYFKPQPLIAVKLISLDFIKQHIIDNLYSDITRKIIRAKTDQDSRSILMSKTDFSHQKFPSIEAYSRNLDEIVSTIKHDNVSLILANQPYLYHQSMSSNELSKIIFPKLYCEQQNVYPNISTLIKEFNRVNAITKKEAESSNVPFIDLNAQLPKNLMYFTDDVHYTESANKKIADILTRFIESNNLIQQ